MPRILDVGQCGYDHGSIARHLKNAYGAEVTAADTNGQALASLRAGDFDLVLVNRVFDGDGTRGVDLIRAIKADPGLAAMAVMLVSDQPEAQAEAVEVGALPGFGKSNLRSGQPVPALESALNRATA